MAKARVSKGFGMKSFKAKLTMLVCLICAILILLILVMARFFLEPAYLSMMQRDLNREIDTLVEIIDGGGLMNPQGTDFSDVFKQDVDPMITEGQCLDVSSSTTGLYIGGTDHIPGCSLHTEREENIWSGWVERRSDNNLLLLRLRAAVCEAGSLGMVVRGRDGVRQYVVGRLMPQQKAVLLLSANLERIYQASEIIQRYLGVVGAILLAVSAVLALVFATWFTRPIVALSAAVRRMAHGDYAVQLPVTQKDEIGRLTQDFNTMAREIGRADALQKDIIANVSHDLRTPLTIIKGYAETIRDLNSEDRDKRNAQLNIIISEADRLSALVGSVMELSRLDAGTEPFHPVTFDISDFCEELSYRYTVICQKNGYRLCVETPGERLITADPDMLSRVLHNLLSNAFAHIGEDGVIVVRVLDEKPRSVCVEVEDHGDGIAADEVNHVFQRYYRARGAKGRPGTGLGLSIVRAVLVTHQFPFGVRSTEGQGSTFWFIAPLATLTPGPLSGRGAEKNWPGRTADRGWFGRGAKKEKTRRAAADTGQRRAASREKPTARRGRSAGDLSRATGTPRLQPPDKKS